MSSSRGLCTTSSPPSPWTSRGSTATTPGTALTAPTPTPATLVMAWASMTPSGPRLLLSTLSKWSVLPAGLENRRGGRSGNAGTAPRMPPPHLDVLKTALKQSLPCSELLSPVPYAIYFWIARDGLIQYYPNYTDASLRRDGLWTVVPFFHSASTVRWEETAQDTASLPRRKGNSGFGLPGHRTQASKFSVSSRKGPLWASLSGCLSFIGKLLTGCKGYPLAMMLSLL